MVRISIAWLFKFSQLILDTGRWLLVGTVAYATQR
jgi:hypothetical protein